NGGALARTLLLAGLGFAAGFLIQGKGWNYQLMPAFALAVAGMAGGPAPRPRAGRGAARPPPRRRDLRRRRTRRPAARRGDPDRGVGLPSPGRRPLPASGRAVGRRAARVGVGRAGLLPVELG